MSSRRRWPIVRAFGISLVSLLPASQAAWADDNSAAVEELFAAGKRLVAAQRYAEACPKFLASYNLEHRVGTLLNLADCYEHNHQVASAWGRFIEARSLAGRNNQPDRAAYADAHAAALEPRRSTLTILADAAIPGLVIARDGAVVDPAVYGVAVPVDGGTHALTVTAPGKVGVTVPVVVAEESDRQAFTVPPLVDVAVLAPTAPPAPAAPPAAPEASRGKPLSTRAIAGIVLAGAGVAGAGVGIGFGVAALNKKSDSAPYCNVGGHPNDCYGPGVGLRSDAVRDATLSSILLGVGAAATVAGVVIWLTAPSASSHAVTAGFDGHTLRVNGTF